MASGASWQSESASARAAAASAGGFDAFGEPMEDPGGGGPIRAVHGRKARKAVSWRLPIQRGQQRVVYSFQVIDSDPEDEVGGVGTSPVADAAADIDISQLEAPTFTTLDRGPSQVNQLMTSLHWDHKVNLIGTKVR